MISFFLIFQDQLDLSLLILLIPLKIDMNLDSFSNSSKV